MEPKSIRDPPNELRRRRNQSKASDVLLSVQSISPHTPDPNRVNKMKSKSKLILDLDRAKRKGPSTAGLEDFRSNIEAMIPIIKSFSILADTQHSSRIAPRLSKSTTRRRIIEACIDSVSLFRSDGQLDRKPIGRAKRKRLEAIFNIKLTTYPDSNFSIIPTFSPLRSAELKTSIVCNPEAYDQRNSFKNEGRPSNFDPIAPHFKSTVPHPPTAQNSALCDSQTNDGLVRIQKPSESIQRTLSGLERPISRVNTNTESLERSQFESQLDWEVVDEDTSKFLREEGLINPISLI